MDEFINIQKQDSFLSPTTAHLLPYPGDAMIDC